MKPGKKVNAKDPQAIAEALAQVGTTVLFANQNLGCAMSFTNTGNGVEKKTHKFSTSHPITTQGALRCSARNELVAAGLLPPKASGSYASAKRLVARGALAAAFSGALLLGGGANNALAEDLGFTYYGGTNPLGEVMTNWASPTFVDIDGDGDLDCFVGSYQGTVDFWKNNGTQVAANFARITGEGNPLSDTVVNYLASPTFVDIDGDGDMDVFIGHGDEMYQMWNGVPGPDSVVSFLENTGTPHAPVFDFNGVITDSRKTVGYNPLVVEGIQKASPAFVDIDNDGDMDAFVGDKSGYLYGYENMTIDEEPAKGTITPTIGFQPHGPSFAYYGEEAGTDYIWAYGGSATPAFTDVDGDGDMDLFVGNKYGTVQYFENTGTPEECIFTARTMDGNPIRVNPGACSEPAFADIHGDGLTDLFLGAIPYQFNFPRKSQDYATEAFSSLMVRYYQNVGTTAKADWRSRGDNPFNLGPNSMGATPAFGDIDNDGDLDALVGSINFGGKMISPINPGGKYWPLFFEGDLQYYENTGTQENPVFALWSGENAPWGCVPDWYLPAPTIADLNGDGINEVYVGFTTSYYKEPQLRRETKQSISPTNEIEAYQFVTCTSMFEPSATNPFADLDDIPFDPQVSFVDIDGDGDLDAFVAGWSTETDDTSILFCRNEGTPITPAFFVVTDTSPMSGVLGAYMPTLSFADVDRDGDMDFFMGDRRSWSSSKDGEEEPNLDLLTTRYFRNIGTATAPAFEEQFGQANPLAQTIQKTIPGAVALADLDNDKDVDAVVGDFYGKLYYYRNIETVDEALAVLDDDDDLCFIESARSDSSLWDRVAQSCRQGAQKVRHFFSPS